MGERSMFAGGLGFWGVRTVASTRGRLFRGLMRSGGTGVLGAIERAVAGAE